jgi:gas vesicle protein
MTMKDQQTDKGINMMVPFLVGSVVGEGLALFLTPKPGKEVRNDIKRFATSTKDRVNMTIVKGKELYDESRVVVENAIDRGKGLYEEGRTAVTSAIDRGKELYEEGRIVVTTAIDAGKTAYVHEKGKMQHT